MKVSGFALSSSPRWILAATLLVASYASASTYPPSKGPQSLRERFATDSTAADFIFVVNTSSGLTDAGVFAEFRTQLPQLLDSFSRRDNFILIGFDDRATKIVSACPVGDDTQPYQSAIFRMRDPRGRAGNFREGLGAAMSALHRPGRAPLQFVFFLLDGKISSEKQAKATPDSLTWETLAKLHTIWQNGSIAEIYGLVVGDPSEVQIARMVFPEIRFIETSVVSLRGFFERWRAELPDRKLRLQLANEIAGNVLTIQPLGRLKFVDRQTSSQLTVRLRSRLRKLPLTLPYVGAWSVFPDWLQVTPHYGDFPLTLGPGQSKDLVVTISRDASENLWGCWHWETRDKELAQISFIPAVSMIDHAAIRNLGADLPTSYMNKLAVEIVRQHGQPAVVLWIAIGILGLMIFSAAISRTYEITGTDFAMFLLKTQYIKAQARFGKYLPQRLVPSEDLKLSFLWIFGTPFIHTMAFVIVTILILVIAEYWPGKIGLGLIGVALLTFWAKVVTTQIRTIASFQEMIDHTVPFPQQEGRMHPLAKPSLDPVADD